MSDIKSTKINKVNVQMSRASFVLKKHIRLSILGRDSVLPCVYLLVLLNLVLIIITFPYVHRTNTSSILI